MFCVPRTINLIFAIAAVSLAAHAQSLDSTSDGSDGALNLMTPGTIVFDPQSFNPRPNSKGDNIYNFTTINIGPGVIVKLSSKNLHSPVFWLAQGDVRIDGLIDLDGEDSNAYASGASHAPTLAGAGGYGGGVGTLNGNTAQSGEGPGAGAPGAGGKFNGNRLLVPLIGGSGGGGSQAASGGGGGGALLIASSTSIIINGTISANGGTQTDPGFSATGGSGGAIRLIAPEITGSNALLTAKGGVANGGASSGQDGYIRLEAFNNDLRGTVNGTPLSTGKPFKLFLPSDPPPSIRVVSIGGAPVESAPNASVELPKATVNQTGPIVLVLEAHYVQPGTTVKVHFYSDSGKDQTVDSIPLMGTFQASQATVSALIANGVTHVSVEAAWPHDSQPVIAEKPAARSFAPSTPKHSTLAEQ